MVVLGITGGVGSGKSKVLHFIKDNYNAKVLLADDIAKELMSEDLTLKERIDTAFKGDNVIDEEGNIIDEKMAQLIFSDAAKRQALNDIVHPAVKSRILDIIDEEKKKALVDSIFVEAALLLEEEYDKYFDVIYIHSSREVRAKRLKESRGYDDIRIENMMNNQLSSQEFKSRCAHTIDNEGDFSLTEEQLSSVLLNQYGLRRNKMPKTQDKEHVFGLDIGTRNVVGTVGYMEGETFKVLAQISTEHKTRSMIDGQIHDIDKVSKVIGQVKSELEDMVGFELKSVCIAAAGRVLQTITTRVEYEYEEESVVTGEDLYTLDLMGVDKAHALLVEKNQNYKFYCVGYTVMKYYLNGEEFTSLEGHKAEKIEEEVIVTFLPEDVVDGLYTAVERVGLSVANLTLEPIAAINVAIPENFRMLNISLVDVGAGTSDICITDDGAIIAYGMIPMAGDELTEVLVKKYLVDFANAEKIKKEAATENEVTYEDIMGITHTVSSKEVWEACEEVLDNITTHISEKIVELNGDKAVAAVFVVGGGGKAHGFTQMLAKKLDIIEERVALRGEDVMKMVEFEQTDVEKDPLLVTPIGICLNYYKQRNSFIMIRFNGDVMKLYDNGYLKIVDAAMQAGLTTDEIFPKRGKEIHFTVNGVKRMERGRAGESAKVFMNGREVGLNDTLLPNCEITIETSTAGEEAVLHIRDLEEFSNVTYVDFIVNESMVHAPRFVEVNGELATADYEIKNGDDVETRAFYTVGQLAEFMDVHIDTNRDVFVNNRIADMDTVIYENFNVEWTIDEYGHIDSDDTKEASGDSVLDNENLTDYAKNEIENATNRAKREKDRKAGIQAEISKRVESEDEQEAKIHDIKVTVNGTEIIMKGKAEYIFVDIYNYYEFDTETPRGKRIVTKLNGGPCSFADVLNDGDVIDLYWESRK